MSKFEFNPLSGQFDLVSDLSGFVPTSRTLTINGTTYDLTANRSWTVGGGGSQTPWTSDIDGDGFSLSNVLGSSIINTTTTNLFGEVAWLSITGSYLEGLYFYFKGYHNGAKYYQNTDYSFYLFHNSVSDKWALDSILGGSADGFIQSTSGGNIDTYSFNGFGGFAGLYFVFGTGIEHITLSGSIEPLSDNVYSLGSPLFKFNSVYSSYFYGDGSNLTNLPFFWTQDSGTLYPTTSTDRVIIGDSVDDTSGALFQVHGADGSVSLTMNDETGNDYFVFNQMSSGSRQALGSFQVLGTSFSDPSRAGNFEFISFTGGSALDFRPEDVSTMKVLNGRVLIAGATDDTTSALQVNGDVKASGTGSTGLILYDTTLAGYYRVTLDNGALVITAV